MSGLEGYQSLQQLPLVDNSKSASNQLNQITALLTSAVEGQARIAQQQDALEHRLAEAERIFRRRSQQPVIRTAVLSERGLTSRRGRNRGGNNIREQEDEPEHLGALKKLQVSTRVKDSEHSHLQRIAVEPRHGGI